MPEIDTLRVVLADDEELGREHLRAYINALNRGGARIELVGTGADGREAVEVVCRERPDVLFLDVSMPDLDGFGVVAELVVKLPQHLPRIVFVTAYDEHAVRAFDRRGILAGACRRQGRAGLDQAQAGLGNAWLTSRETMPDGDYS